MEKGTHLIKPSFEQKCVLKNTFDPNSNIHQDKCNQENNYKFFQALIVFNCDDQS